MQYFNWKLGILTILQPLLCISPFVWVNICTLFSKLCRNLEFFAWVLSYFLEAWVFVSLSFFQTVQKKACIKLWKTLAIQPSEIEQWGRIWEAIFVTFTKCPNKECFCLRLFSPFLVQKNGEKMHEFPCFAVSNGRTGGGKKWEFARAMNISSL